MRFALVFISSIMLLFLASCANSQVTPSTPTLTPTFSRASTSTATYTPAPTSTTTPTQTSLADSAVKQIIQERYSIIQPENVNSILQLVRYARFKIQYSYLSDIVEDVAFSPNSYVLAFGSGNGAGLWDIGKQLTQPSTENNLVDISQDHIYKVSFSSDGQLVAISESPKKPVFDLYSHKFLSLPRVSSAWNWRESNLYPEKNLEVPTEYKPSKDDGYFNTSIAFSPNGKLIASGIHFWRPQQSFVEAVIFLWDFDTGQVINILGKNDIKGNVNSLSFNPDGNLLVSGSWDGKVRLWDVKNGNLLSTLDECGYITHAVAFSPDGQIFAAGCQDGTIRIWDTKTLKLIHTIRAHVVRTTKIAFSFDGRFIASSGYDGAIGLWGVYVP